MFHIYWIVKISYFIDLIKYKLNSGIKRCNNQNLKYLYFIGKLITFVIVTFIKLYFSFVRQIPENE